MDRVDTFRAAYKNNEVRADQQYKGKYAAISGQVGDVKKDLVDSMYVTLGTGKIFEIPVIQCHLNSTQTTKAASLSKGQKATVVGRIEGLMVNVQLQDCEIR